MTGSVKTMFLLSLGLLCVSAITVASEENKALSVQNIVKENSENSQDLVVGSEDNKDLVVGSEDNKDLVVDSEDNKDPKVESEDKSEGENLDIDLEDKEAQAGSQEPGYVSSFWNGTCGCASDSWSFVGSNPWKTILMTFGIIEVASITCNVYRVLFGEEDKNIRRRPRFNSISPRLECVDC